MSERLVIVSLLTVIAVRKKWLELFKHIIFFITFHVLCRFLILSWKKSSKTKLFPFSILLIKDVALPVPYDVGLLFFIRVFQCNKL